MLDVFGFLPAMKSIWLRKISSGDFLLQYIFDGYVARA